MTTNYTSGLQVGVGVVGYPNQWYLPGFDSTSVPARRDETPQSDAITVYDAAPFTSPGRVVRIGDSVLFGVTAPGYPDHVGTTINYFTVTSPWNTLKNVLLTSDRAEQVQVNGAVHVDVQLSATTTDNSLVSLIGVKRGNVVTGEGDDTISVQWLRNNDDWINQFRVTANDGDDLVQFKPFDMARAQDDAYRAVDLASYVKDGSGQKAFVDLGAGDDDFSGANTNAIYEVRGFNGSDFMVGGHNDDKLAGDRGRDFIYGGYGRDVIDTGYEGRTTEAASVQADVYSALQNGTMTDALLARFDAVAELGDGGHDNDRLFSMGRWNLTQEVDGSDVLVGYRGADRFYFVGEFGTDVVRDFVAGAASTDREANAGDRLMYEGVVTGNNSIFTFQRVNFDGDTNDLLISWGYGVESGLNVAQGAHDRALILKDFFTLNNGVIDTSAYQGTTWNVAQIAGLGVNNIFSFDAAEHTAVRADYNFFGGLV